jgi:DNA topoisomerase VI subunit B
VYANDVSNASLDATKETLRPFIGRVKRIEYMRYDIAQTQLPGTYHIVILSQTIPFISDDKALINKRLGFGSPSELRLHQLAKKRVLELKTTV